jgi:thiamine-phosphate pyrophosphorylase
MRKLMVTKKDMRLYAITDRQWLGEKDFYEVVESVLAGGATFLQLREKQASYEERLDMAKKIKKIALKYNVPFVIDDDVSVALESGADGVHIGQSDMDYEQARKLLGTDKIIGMTAKTRQQALLAEKLGADYIGVGAVFHTTTKKDAKDMTRDTLLEITEAVSIPVVAIGGINYDNMDTLKGTGVDGIAVISAIFAKADEEEATRRLREKAEGLF